MRNLHREKIWIDNNMLDLAKNLKKNGHRVMILSNESKEGMEDKKNKFLLSDIFEKIYNSAKIGIAKPDKEIFDYVLTDLNVDPASIIFIDDWDKNIISARNAGMHTVQFYDVEQLKQELSL